MLYNLKGTKGCPVKSVLLIPDSSYLTTLVETTNIISFLHILPEIFIYFLLELIYNAGSISVVQQIHPVTHTYTHTHTHTQSHIYIHSLSYIIFHYGLSQKTGYSSLSCRVGCQKYLMHIYANVYKYPIPSLFNFILKCLNLKETDYFRAVLSSQQN